MPSAPPKARGLSVPGPPRGLPRWVEAPLALAGLIAAAPLLALAMLAVRATSPGPAIFRQTRIGRDGRPFELLKLRTMRVGGSGAAVTAADDLRVTPLGRLLRRTKLDELPALVNVLRGELSFVGPRPEVPRYVDLDDVRWRRVLAARPGITDPVTLRLRDEESILAGIAAADREAWYRERLVPFKLAGYRTYLDRRSPWRDLGVLVRTVLGVLRIGRVVAPGRDEIEAASHAARADQ